MLAFKEMSVTQRVKYLIEEEKIFNQARLADLMGLSRATISEHLKKESDLPTKYLTEIAKEYKVSPNWLLTGEGQPLKKEYKIESEPIEVNEPQEVIQVFTNGKEKHHELQAIPLYDITAAAGLSSLYNSSNNILDYLSIPNLPRCDGAINVKGDSMYPLPNPPNGGAHQASHQHPIKHLHHPLRVPVVITVSFHFDSK